MLFHMHFCQMRICDNKWVLKSVGVCTLFHTFCFFSKLKVVELKLTLTLVSRSNVMVEIFNCFLYKLSELQRYFFLASMKAHISLRGAIGQRVRLLTERLVVQAHPGATFCFGNSVLLASFLFNLYHCSNGIPFRQQKHIIKKFYAVDILCCLNIICLFSLVVIMSLQHFRKYEFHLGLLPYSMNFIDNFMLETTNFNLILFREKCNH